MDKTKFRLLKKSRWLYMPQQWHPSGWENLAWKAISRVDAKLIIKWAKNEK